MVLGALNKKDTLGECPRGYAPVEAGEGAKVGNLALDSMLFGADADVKAVCLYCEGEKSSSNLHSVLLSLVGVCDGFDLSCRPLFQSLEGSTRGGWFTFLYRTTGLHAVGKSLSDWVLHDHGGIPISVALSSYLVSVL